MYGFTNVTDPCFDQATSSVCANPNSYLFWDGVHPTAHGAEIIGDAFAQQVVPEPTTLTLVGLGVATLSAMRRRRA